MIPTEHYTLNLVGDKTELKCFHFDGEFLLCFECCPPAPRYPWERPSWSGRSWGRGGGGSCPTWCLSRLDRRCGSVHLSHLHTQSYLSDCVHTSGLANLCKVLTIKKLPEISNLPDVTLGACTGYDHFYIPFRTDRISSHN